jgi:hypothetical protein
VLITACLAWAQRPTEGGSYAFDETDEVTSLDSADGAVRVWYSTAGPNEVRAGDDDGDGVPDFAQTVAEHASAALELYAELGFRPVVSDEGKGGSDAMDAYLVDFGGDADGAYNAESCSKDVCSGYFAMENDFSGYGYADVDTAIMVLTSHELFHAIQAAYDYDEESWLSEGTATWAENVYDPGSSDFLGFCDDYLADAGRSLDQPPGGPVPAFSYGTALWWFYLSERYGTDIIVGILEASAETDDVLTEMSALEEAGGGTLRDDWSTFARWNLSTGDLDGGWGWEFASRIGPVPTEAEGEAIEDDNRYYPLAATYYRVDHAGGHLAFALEESAPELAFSLHAEVDGAVQEALATWDGSAGQSWTLDAGSYWLVGSNPTLAENSTKVLTCLGADVRACEAADTGTPDTGPPDTGDSTVPADTGDSGAPTPGSGATKGEEPAGCGCGAATPVASWLAGLALLALRRRG